jgi:hypothetical protein
MLTKRLNLQGYWHAAVCCTMQLGQLVFVATAGTTAIVSQPGGTKLLAAKRNAVHCTATTVTVVASLSDQACWFNPTHFITPHSA